MEPIIRGITLVGLVGGGIGFGTLKWYEARISQKFVQQEWYRKSVSMLQRYKPAENFLGSPIYGGPLSLYKRSKLMVVDCTAKAVIPVEGSKGKGHMHVLASRKEFGQSWDIDQLDLELSDQHWKFYDRNSKDNVEKIGDLSHQEWYKKSIEMLNRYKFATEGFLGSPISGGEITVYDGSEIKVLECNAMAVIPVEGPKGKGRMKVVASRKDNSQSWDIDRLYLKDNSSLFWKFYDEKEDQTKSKNLTDSIDLVKVNGVEDQKELRSYQDLFDMYRTAFRTVD